MNCIECGHAVGDLDRIVVVSMPSLQNGLYPETQGVIHLWHLLNPDSTP